MGVRKNFLFLSPLERDGFFEAILKMKAHIVNPAAPVADRYSVYDQFVFHHLAVFTVINPTTGMLYNAGHGAAAFLSWHRELLLRFEAALRVEVPGVSLPYWDWSPAVFTPALMGPNGGPGGAGGGVVESSLFAYDPPGTGTNTLPLPGYYPSTLPGWRIRPDLDDNTDGVRLRRFIGAGAVDVLPVFSDVNAILGATSALTFRARLEEGSLTISSHNEVHRYIAGHMGAAASPNDPIFWLHHCNIDRLWAMWQLDGHAGSGFFPASTAFGHTLSSPMWPWTGAVVFPLPAGLPTYYLPDFSGEPARVNSDLLDHHAAGYAYDTEPVVGVAVDRSGSMQGMTSDPLAAMAPITKWALAQKGVQHFLSDCRAAYTARAAYVIGGVNTFTSSGASPLVAPVLSAQPYGLVRNGAYDPATVTTALGALPASGGTPLASALTQTRSTVVRPPANALPSDDVRYLAMLTDGKETVPPNLSTLATGGFADTLVFGMGLGNGTSWDGVDYATVQTIVEKGRNPGSAASRVFHGESAGVIDKFFTNTIAQAIGYTAAIDPRFDLFPGEHTHLPFYVTSADESILITVLRGDARDEPWHIALYDPRGGVHEASVDSPMTFVFQREGGRDTIFVHRNGGDAASWVGRWHLHVAYVRPGQDGHAHADTADAGSAHTGHPGGGGGVAGHAPRGGMAMMNTWDLMIPAGAPPLRGPVFAHFDQPARQRMAVRLLPSASKLPTALGGPVLEQPGETSTASAVLVGIYMKTTLRVTARFDAEARFAGAPLRLRVGIEETAGGQITEARVLGRLIAPLRSPGHALLDTKTLPLKERARFRVEQDDGVRIDLLALLAEYERRRPGVFAPRDEPLAFEKQADGVHVAEIADTRVPGLYQAGMYVEGRLEREGSPPEWFARVVSVDRGLATRIDPARSRPLLQWVSPQDFVVVVTPQDSSGHLLAPSSLGGAVLRFSGRETAVLAVPGLDGSVRFEGKLHEGLGKVKPEGCCADADTHVHAASGEAVLLRAGEELKLTLEISGHALAVRPAAFVAHRGRLRLAASPEVLRLPLDSRVAFADAEEARRAGHVIPPGLGQGHSHGGAPGTGPGHEGGHDHEESTPRQPPSGRRKRR